MRGLVALSRGVLTDSSANLSRQKSAGERVSRGGLSPSELCLHALAQVPARVHLSLPESAEAPQLLQIAASYGVRERVRVESGSTEPCFVASDGAATPSLDHRVMTLGEIVEALAPGEGVRAAPNAGDSMLSGHRVVILTNYPAHYRLPLFTLMSERLVSVGAELHVLFLATQARARPWLAGGDLEFQHEFLSSARLPVGPRGMLVPTRLERSLAALRPTIVLVASLSPFIGMRAARIARRLGARLGIWSGETPQMTTARSRTRRASRRRLLASADFAIAYGSRSAGYLRAMSSDLPLVLGRNTAPVPDSSPAREPDVDAPIRLVLVGDLASPRKGVDIALRALQEMRNEQVVLTIVGGGRLLRELRHDVEADPRIRFLGALAPPGVAAALAEADAFLFPTRSDIFGLALVEAMGSQAAPIVSRAAGAVDDLAVDGHNALVVDGHDPATWARSIERIVDDAELRRALADRAHRTIAARWTVQHAADAMIAGLRLGVLTSGERSAA